MLRRVIQIAAVLLVAGAMMLTVSQSSCWPTLILPALLMAGIFCERRYKGLSAATFTRSPDFRPTGERFVDPETGRIKSVVADPATGARRYVDEGEPPIPHS